MNKILLSEYHANLTSIKKKRNIRENTNCIITYHLINNSGSDVELVTLNMQWRVTIGASFNLLHRAKRRKRERIYDSYNGFITGVNFNGLMILDMLAQGLL